MTAGNQHKTSIIFAPVTDELLSVEQYTQVINQNPCHAPAYLNRGFAYHQQGRYEMAIQDYEEAIRLNPDFIDAYYLRQQAREKAKAKQEHSIRALAPA